MDRRCPDVNVTHVATMSRPQPLTGGTLGRARRGRSPRPSPSSHLFGGRTPRRRHMQRDFGRSPPQAASRRSMSGGRPCDAEARQSMSCDRRLFLMARASLTAASTRRAAGIFPARQKSAAPYQGASSTRATSTTWTRSHRHRDTGPLRRTTNHPPWTSSRSWRPDESARVSIAYCWRHAVWARERSMPWRREPRVPLRSARP
jgi:hypothetical protein